MPNKRQSKLKRPENNTDDGNRVLRSCGRHSLRFFGYLTACSPAKQTHICVVPSGRREKTQIKNKRHTHGSPTTDTDRTTRKSVSREILITIYNITVACDPTWRCTFTTKALLLLLSHTDTRVTHTHAPFTAYPFTHTHGIRTHTHTHTYERAHNIYTRDCNVPRAVVQGFPKYGDTFVRSLRGWQHPARRLFFFFFFNSKRKSVGTRTLGKYRVGAGT